MRVRRDEASEEAIPGLPEELAIQCFARVPRADLLRLTRVSRSWKHLIVDKSTQIVETRKYLGIREDWPFVLLQGQHDNGRVWRALDPVTRQWCALPLYGADEVFHSGDKECFVAGRNLMFVGIQAFQNAMNEIGSTQVIWNYDHDDDSWSIGPPMRIHRCLFASASTGPYAYVAGGTIISDYRKVSDIVERYDSVSKTWEQLPNMTFERKACSGFIMEGRFYVIGGVDINDEPYDNGEYYDPETRTWTTVPDFWQVANADQARGGAGGAPPLVAVVKNELYSLDPSANEVKHYDKIAGRWIPLTAVPGRAHDGNGWGLAFKAVGDELWVICGRSPQGHHAGDIQAFEPDPGQDQPAAWRRVAYTFSRDGFCLNCAVMKL